MDKSQGTIYKSRHATGRRIKLVKSRRHPEQEARELRWLVRLVLGLAIGLWIVVIVLLAVP